MNQKVKKILIAVASAIVVVILSIVTTLLMNRHKAVDASTSVANGLSAYEIAKAYGYP